MDQISLADEHYAVMLQPLAVTFDVQAAANSGAYQSSRHDGLIWDSTLIAWTSASWEATMGLQYDINS